MAVRYVATRSLASGASNSTTAKLTPPWSSPAPDSMASRIRGSTTRQVEHQEAVQRVRRGLFAAVERER